MADTATVERSLDMNTPLGKPEAMLAKEVESALEAAVRTRPEGRPKTRPWYFRMPQAGVRYYSL